MSPHEPEAEPSPPVAPLAPPPPSPLGAGDTPLLGEVYAQLRAIAQRQMQEERPGHTLTATALVHEVYIKLAPNGLPIQDKARFFNAAAAAMRRILIDHARRRGADKRGGGLRRLGDIESVADLAREDHLETALALDEAILRLEEEDAAAAAVVRLRFYAGLSGEAAAEVLGISPRQADREWAFARAFLLQQLRGEASAEPAG